MTRRLAREEGLFVGWSSGSAVFGALEYAQKHLTENDLMVVILPDHGTRYLAKVYNDNWMKDHGYLESREFATANDIIRNRKSASKLISIHENEKVGVAISKLTQSGISQVPVTDGEHIIGSLTDSRILKKFIEDPSIQNKAVKEVMDKPFTFVGLDNTIDVLSSLIDEQHSALLVRDQNNEVQIITQADLLMALSK